MIQDVGYFVVVMMVRFESLLIVGLENRRTEKIGRQQRGTVKNLGYSNEVQ